jgi:AGZA family xanthine/uracil permease-like MFS transporter
VLWVGVIITAQAFQATPPEHAPAVAIGLCPSIAAWGATIVQGAVRVAGGATLQDALARVDPPTFNALATEVTGFLIHALIVFERGYNFTCMILAAIAALLIDRRFSELECFRSSELPAPAWADARVAVDGQHDRLLVQRRTTRRRRWGTRSVA